MLSSADGYCSIVVFDMAELGTVHPTQQHHRQLAAIAQSHSHPTPSVPHSPAISITRQSPAPGLARSEREGSSSSSIAQPPLFAMNPHAPSSTASSTDPTLPIPGDEAESYGFSRAVVSSESGSAIGLGLSAGVEEAGSKRSAAESEGPKKKRRIALTHLGDGEGS